MFGFRQLSSLNAKFVAACSLSFAIFLVVSVALISFLFRDYKATQQSYDALMVYRQTLVAATAISAERGPTNVQLGAERSSDPAGLARLAQFRAHSDAALDEVSALNRQFPGFSAEDELRHARSVLAAARTKVDSVLDMPLAARDLEALQSAINRMFLAVDALRPLINVAALHSIERDRGLADQALIGQKLFEIRDYAGRLGSIMAPFIATRQAMTAEEHDRLQQVLGRVHQLWELTEPYLRRYPELSGALADVDRDYFRNGLAIIDRLMDEAKTGDYSVSTRDMTNLIVPTFTPLERVRVEYLGLMLQRADASMTSAREWMAAVAAATLLIMAINISLLLGIQRLIFKPLLLARNVVVGLSEEKELDARISGPRTGREIIELFGAINVLQRKLLERREMTAGLRRQAATDGLTGLLNRRAFDQIGEGHCDYQDFAEDVGLIIVDIDRFKSINDTYGHLAGDVVLRSVAQAIVSNIRESDLVARYGGEEFALILPNVSVEELLHVAEALRAMIGSLVIDLGQGAFVRVTASFGISLGRRGGPPWRDVVAVADEALYRAKRAGRDCVRAGEPWSERMTA